MTETLTKEEKKWCFLDWGSHAEDTGLFVVRNSPGKAPVSEDKPLILAASIRSVGFLVSISADPLKTLRGTFYCLMVLNSFDSDLIFKTFRK